jgi:hypothetical protein
MNFKRLLQTLVALICLPFYSVLAQESAANLTGTITDASNGEGLIGASIVLVGTYNGGSADVSGNYVINKIKPKFLMVYLLNRVRLKHLTLRFASKQNL